MPIRPSRITCFFVFGDIFSFLLQSSDGGLEASGSASSLKTDTDLILIGLAVQIVFFLTFTLLIIISDCRTFNKKSEPSEGNWKLLLRALEARCVLIMILSVYRVIEFVDGFNGYVLNHEASFYVFDALTIFFVQVLYNTIHPKRVLTLPGSKSVNVKT